MLEPITCRMSDESSNRVYRFSFYCDLCGKPWTCDPIMAVDHDNEKPTAALQESIEHQSAYERANLEAMRNFNRCPLCKRWVCDDCFRIMQEGDFCSECAVQNFLKSKK